MSEHACASNRDRLHIITPVAVLLGLWACARAQDQTRAGSGQYELPTPVFRADFEGVPAAGRSVGSGSATYGRVVYAPGRFGQAGRPVPFSFVRGVRYRVAGNMRMDRGAVAFWFRMNGRAILNKQTPEWRLFHTDTQWKAPGLFRITAIRGWFGMYVASERGKLCCACMCQLAARKIDFGQWHHVVGCWDSAQGIRLSLDGRGIASREGKWEPAPAPRWFVVGEQVDAFYDDLRIYARPLTSEEVAILYGLQRVGP